LGISNHPSYSTPLPYFFIRKEKAIYYPLLPSQGEFSFIKNREALHIEREERGYTSIFLVSPGF
jgi:hypothetical protein